MVNGIVVSGTTWKSSRLAVKLNVNIRIIEPARPKRDVQEY